MLRLVLLICLFTTVTGCLQGDHASKPSDVGFEPLDRFSSMASEFSRSEENHEGLRSAILATAGVRCGANHGTVAFIGANGEFVTSRRFLNGDGANCRIEMQSLGPDDFFERVFITRHVLVEGRKSSIHNWNLVHGRIEGLRTPNFFRPSSGHVSIGERALFLGYPLAVNSGMSSPHIPHPEGSIRIRCNAHLNGLTEVAVRSPEDEAELASRRRAFEAMCARRTSPERREEMRSFDRGVSVQGGLHIAQGEVFYVDNLSLVASPDYRSGMRGGPIINERGELLGIQDFSVVGDSFRGLDQEAYVGAGLWLRTQEARVLELVATQDDRVNLESCLCEWIVEIPNEGLIRTMWPGTSRSASQCEAMEGFTREKSDGVRSVFSNCGLETISLPVNTSLREIRPGSVMRLEVRGVVGIDSRIQRHFDMWWAVDATCKERSGFELVGLDPNIIEGVGSIDFEHSVIGRESEFCDGFGGDMYTFTVDGREFKLYAQYNTTGQIAAQALVDAFQAMTWEGEDVRIVIRRSNPGSEPAYSWSISGQYLRIDDALLENPSELAAALEEFSKGSGEDAN